MAAAAALGSCIHVYTEAAEVQLASVRRYQRRQAEEPFLPRAVCTSVAERLTVNFYFGLHPSPPSPHPSARPSLEIPPFRRICISLALPPALFPGGNPPVPRRPVCASAEMTSILSGASCIVLLRTISATFATLRAPPCRRI